MSVYELLRRRTRPEHWADAFYWLLMSSVGGLFPLWGTWLLMRPLNQTIQPETFSQNGEFALYSAAMVSAAIYVVTKEDSRNIIRSVTNFLAQRKAESSPKGAFPGQRWFLFCFFFTLGISALLFAAATFAHIPGVGVELDVKWLSTVTFWIFVVTLAISYLVTVLDNTVFTLSSAEIREMFKQPGDQLKDDFDAFLKGE